MAIFSSFHYLKSRIFLGDSKQFSHHCLITILISLFLMKLHTILGIQIIFFCHCLKSSKHSSYYIPQQFQFNSYIVNQICRHKQNFMFSSLFGKIKFKTINKSHTISITMSFLYKKDNLCQKSQQ